MLLVEQRRTARFELHLPLRIMGLEANRVCPFGLTRNIGLGGVLFTSDKEVPIGHAIEYVVTLSENCGSHVELRCFGKVLRLDNAPSERRTPCYLIAATLDRYHFVRIKSA